jgi:ATP-dependent DNA helicase RecG
LGTDIQIKMFDDRFVVESPGTLPGLVRLNNMRNMHFSRNPMIARYLRDYKFVRELGEGVDRMYRELLEAGFPTLEYKVVGFMTILIVKKFIGSEKEKNELLNEPLNEPLNDIIKIELSEIERVVLSKIKIKNSITKKEISKQIEWSEASVKRAMDSLKEKGILERKGSKKTGYWQINKVSIDLLSGEKNQIAMVLSDNQTVDSIE